MAEIREANLSYLILAQTLIRADRAQALFRLGVSEAVADLIDALTPGQILKVAASNMLMCRFRFDDEMVWTLLTDPVQASATSEESAGSANRLHASILMSGRFGEALHA
ncbi:MAG: flagellar transcriptional regulator FlhD [Burkholderiaceae bacterium]